MRTTIGRLVETASGHGTASASNGRWRATLDPDGSVDVWHYSTRMIRVHPERRHVVAIDEGWGSQTDKQGINSILRHECIGESYWSLFDGEVHTGNGGVKR